MIDYAVIAQQIPRSDRVYLRFDIDTHPASAMDIAAINYRLNLKADYYFLHTLGYFQNPKMERWVKNIMDYGGRVGLHTDPYLCYSRGQSGAREVFMGIDRLRTMGADVISTCAHRSYPVYNAEAFEIFTQYKRRVSMCAYPTGVLDMFSLGLEYEANLPTIVDGDADDIDAYCSLDNDTESLPWMKTHLACNPTFRHGYDCVIWLHIDGRWSVKTPEGFLFKTTPNVMFSLLDDSQLKNRTAMFVLHPEFT